MTERLYYTDAYRRDFDARVIERGEGGRRLYLDRTAFYPTSGGQPFDTGTLAGIPVVDVIDEGERIAHVLAAPAPAPVAGSVRGEIDWARRFDHMQQHTGQHLLSAVLAELFALETASVHFGADLSTIDLAADAVSREQLLAAEERANTVIAEDRPVAVSFEDAATATGLRKAPDRAGTLRIVTIDGIDRSACGGTHVRATGAIGAILLRRVERVRRATRVEFVCGLRAVRRARADFDALSDAARDLSSSIDELPALVRARDEELRAALAARRELAVRLDGYRARELYDAAERDPAGVHRIIERRDSGALDELRSLAQAASALPRALFIGVIERPGGVVVAAADDAGVDAGVVLKHALAETGGRGGGSPRLAQGSSPDPEGVVRAILQYVSGSAGP